MLRFNAVWYFGEVFTNESCLRTDKCVQHVGEMFADVRDVNQMALVMLRLCMGRCILWTTNTGAFY